jgi:hypothetical protein
MVLFFVISLVAVYTSRNLIFEQRTSANQYRSTQAYEAAEAGIEWALSMLNSGSIDSNCAPNPGSTFRSRMLDIDPLAGSIRRKQYGAFAPYAPVCAATGSAWSCVCPDSNSAPGLMPATVSGSAFRLTFDVRSVRQGVIKLTSQGCTRLSIDCLDVDTLGQQGDAVAVVSVMVALKGAIAAAPLAALTAGAQVEISGGTAATLVNAEPATDGITVNARRDIHFHPNAVQTGVAGSTNAPVMKDHDSFLPSTADAMFVSMFGMRRSTYKLQPAVILLNCSATSSPCAASNLKQLADRNPGRILWLEGDAALDAPAVGPDVDIGSSGAPVVIVAHGQLSKTSSSRAVRIFGLLYQFDERGPWTQDVRDLYVQGATVAEGDITWANSSPTLVYDLGILNRLRLTSGSFVRVPGSWQDTQ